tara:strand:- start:7298 stop:7930 length:633 start_codon:yes stop_codon:yes gene_type:complete
MCGIIGALIKEPTVKDFELLRNLFLHSKVRGCHATGASWVSGGKVCTIKEECSADVFLRRHLNFNEMVNEDGNMYLIGHCRYSTSEIKDNQPIANEVLSIVHNGVISQELPEKWEELYGFRCSTRNDTQLLHESLLCNKDPFEVWKESSFSVCELRCDKTIIGYRNGKRPLYYSDTNNARYITSTQDIAIRAGLTNPKPYTCAKEDWQHV